MIEKCYALVNKKTGECGIAFTMKVQAQDELRSLYNRNDREMTIERRYIISEELKQIYEKLEEAAKALTVNYIAQDILNPILRDIAEAKL